MLKEKPVLYVIMGASGAGKSFYGKYYVPEDCKIFDPDQEALRIQERKGYSLKEAYEAMNELFSMKVNSVLEQKKDFAFENHSGAPPVVELFKQRGYDIQCVYFGLDSVNDSIYRVQLRMLLGGHKVTAVNAKNSFDVSKKNVIEMKDKFEHIQFVAVNADGGSKLIASYDDEEFDLVDKGCKWGIELAEFFL